MRYPPVIYNELALMSNLLGSSGFCRVSGHCDFEPLSMSLQRGGLRAQSNTPLVHNEFIQWHENRALSLEKMPLIQNR